MGYKILGYIVWQGGKWYARRRFGDARRNAAISAVVALVLAGVLAASKQRLNQRHN